jgi:AcrR family transcriptional regulator
MARRDEIVRVAQRLFAEQGYRGTTMADIAKGVGLSPSAGGLYRHFPSKADMFDAVIEHALSKVAEAEEFRAMAREADLPVAEEIELAGRFLLRQIRGSAEILRIFDRDLGDLPDQAERVRTELLAPVMGGLEGWVAHLGERTGSPVADPSSLVVPLWCALLYQGTSPMAGPTSDRDEAFLCGWSALLLAVIGTPSDQPL